ncbi:hypothetical protein ACHAXM_010485 [Skeletonema potamos]
MDSPGNYKRRRTSLVGSSASASINDLSVDLCCIIADFLPKTARVLLAVAFLPKTESGWKGQPGNVSKAIISRTKAGGSFATVLEEICKEEAEAEALNLGKCRALKTWELNEHDPLTGEVIEHDQKQIFRGCLSKQLKEYYNGRWETLDFVDVPLSLASRLTDDDLAAILLCVDAKHNIQQRKLTHCTNIVGYGLEPLRQSTVLEKLNLGLVRQFEAPYWLQISIGRSEFLFDDAKLSEDPVCDLIDSILREEGNSFKRLQYPYKWSNKSSEPDTIVPMYDKQVLRSERMRQFVDDHGAVVNKFACCMYFGFGDKKEFSYDRLNWDSDLVDACIACHGKTYAVCSNCNDIVCFECCETEECEVCHIINYCPRCCRDNVISENAVTWCGSNCPSYCSSCRVRSCRNGTNSCTDCRSEVFDVLLDECRTKQVQIDSQNDEIDRLRSVIAADRVLIMVVDQHGEAAQYKMKWTSKISKIFLAHASRKGVEISTIRFTWRGGTIQPEDTPRSLGLSSNDRIDAAMIN